MQNLKVMDFTEAELEAYLEESLGPLRAADLEKSLREDPGLIEKLSHINARRDAGIHTIGEIWRRNQVGVPSDQQISSFLMGVASDDEADYIRFRLEVLKCPFTIACWKDLKSKQNSNEDGSTRRKKYFNSSAGLLRKPEDER